MAWNGRTDSLTARLSPSAKPHHINSIFIINTPILYIYICYTFPSHARLIPHSQKTITVCHDFVIYDTVLSRTVPSSITKANHSSSLLYNIQDSIVTQMSPLFHKNKYNRSNSLFYNLRDSTLTHGSLLYRKRSSQ